MDPTLSTWPSDPRQYPQHEPLPRPQPYRADHFNPRRPPHETDAITLYTYDAVCPPVQTSRSNLVQAYPANWPPGSANAQHEPIRAKPPASGSRGRDYLLSLSNSMKNMDLNLASHQRASSAPVETSLTAAALGERMDKPLPRLPPPPLPARPWSDLQQRPAQIWRVSADPKVQDARHTSYSIDRPGGLSWSASRPPIIIPQFKPPPLPTSFSQPTLRAPHRPYPTTPAQRPLSDSVRQPSSAPAARVYPTSPPSKPSTQPKRRTGSPAQKQKHPARRSQVIDLTYIPSSPSSASSASTSSPPDNVTPRSAHRAARASEVNARFSHSPTKTPARGPRHAHAAGTPVSLASLVSLADSPGSTATGSPRSKRLGETRQCCGFTKTGQRCKRQVKVDWAASVSLSPAPPSTMTSNLALEAEGVEDEPEPDGAYCKDHAGLICQPEGFYWRHPPPVSLNTGKQAQDMWIDFARYIPHDMDSRQQVQAQLRACMESPLTAKEEAGIIYVYELRDLQTPTTTFYKVGKTTNLARRMTEWRTRCASHSMILRDEFPLRPPLPSPATIHHPVSHPSMGIGASGLSRKPSGPNSFLPGHIRTSASRTLSPAVKRLERLIHIELGERSRQTRPDELKRARARCDDCGKEHREIFPLERTGEGGEYDEIIREVIMRWEGFVRLICTGNG